jgi:hypothetical protein
VEPKEIQEIVTAYGAAMGARGDVVILDESRLPYPKPLIKTALIAAMGMTGKGVGHQSLRRRS